MSRTLPSSCCNPSLKNNLLYLIIALFFSALTLWLGKGYFIPQHQISVSFHQKTSAPVHFAIWYKTSEKEDFTRERCITHKKELRESTVTFDLPTAHLHQFRLDFPPISEADITLSNIKISTGEKTYHFDDLSALAFIVPKSASLKKNGSSATWHCSRPVSKIRPINPPKIQAERNILWFEMTLTSALCIFTYYGIFCLLFKLLHHRRSIVESYKKRESIGNVAVFLPHLEGLRGFAIVLILLFHLGTTGVRSPISLSGGYLGVEIFLVLTGYLLALGFCRRHESLMSFIRKKLLRIMLPVSVLVTITMGVCLFCMDYEDLCATANNAWYALLGCSNIQLSADGAEYFAADQAFNPLLHMWYIAITLQLYLILYLGYLLIWHFPKWLKILILLLLAGFSYAYGHCHTLRAELVTAWDLPLWMSQEGSMYYSTLARLWEAILGIGILLLPPGNRKSISSVLCSIAILAILLCVWYLPPHAMLITAAATAVLIRYGNTGIAAHLFTNKATRFVGKISFSIYLVHMPLLVCYKCATFTALGYPAAIALLLGSILLGWGFWWLIEKRHTPTWGLLLVWLSGLGFAQLLIQTDGLRNRWNAESNAQVYPSYPHWKEETDPQSYVGFDKNHLRFEYGWVRLVGGSRAGWPGHKWLLRLGVSDQKPNFVLIGDSHAQHYIMGLDVFCKKNNLAGIYLGAIMVPFWNREEPEASRNYFFNREKAYAFINWLKAQPGITHVCIAQTGSRFKSLHLDWDKKELPRTEESNLPAFRDFSVHLKKIGKEVIVFAPLPRFVEKSPIRYYRFLKRTGQTTNEAPYPDTIFTKQEFDEMYDKVMPYLEQLHKEGVCSVLYPHRYLFRNDIASMERDGILIYKDYNHFTVDGSIKVIEAISEELLSMLQQDTNASSK